MKCPRSECSGMLDVAGACETCGEGSVLSAAPDLEAGRLFDEWWASVPRSDMERLDEEGNVQESFDTWRAARSVKH